MKQKCIFLDRDGVLNHDRPDYVYRLEDYKIIDGVIDGLTRLKKAGYLLIVITNQAGIAKGLYKREDVRRCHDYFQQQSGAILDDLYFASHHPNYSSNTLMRKPGSLMLEKAMAKYNIDPEASWMIGDKASDVEAGRQAGVKTIHIAPATTQWVGDAQANSLFEAAEVVLQNVA